MKFISDDATLPALTNIMDRGEVQEMGNEDPDKDLHNRISGNPPSREQAHAKDDQRTVGDAYEDVTIGGAEETWLPIETKLVTRSLILGVVALIVLATLVHMFILGGQ
jgi:hypothetical protein